MRFQNFITLLRRIKAPSEYLATQLPENEAATQRVCTTCAHVGTPTRQMTGRVEIEWALWAVVAVLAIIYITDFIILRFTTFFLFRWLFKLTSMTGKVFVVLSIAYTLIRISIRTNICPKCGSNQVIPLDSPRAKELLKR